MEIAHRARVDADAATASMLSVYRTSQSEIRSPRLRWALWPAMNSERTSPFLETRFWQNESSRCLRTTLLPDPFD